MSQLFGNPEDFGIEAGIEPDGHISHTIWGHMQIWCRGHRLGNIEDRYCGIGQAYGSFRDLLPQLDTLWASEFEGQNDVDILNLLDRVLYGCEGQVELQLCRTLAQVAADAKTWGRFDFLTNWGAQFNECKAFIVCPPGGEMRILSRNLPEETGWRVSVTRKSFLLAAEGFIRWFEAQSRRLGIPY